MYVCVYLRGHVCEEQKLTLDSLPQVSPTLFSETGSLTGLKLFTKYTSLAVQPAPRICVSLPSQHWDYKSMPTHSGFFLKIWVLGSNSGPHACVTSNLLTEPFSQPHD